MCDPATIAYVTGTYARASDTFIRDEVAHLRAIGHTVHTYSIREPSAAEAVDAAALDDRARTHYLIKEAGPAGIIAAGLAKAGQSPVRLARLIRIARRCTPRGPIGAGLALAYVAEGCRLANHMRNRGIRHLHNHIPEGSAVATLVCADLLGIPFSLTVHGPGEFDRAAAIGLDEKVSRSAFAATVSHYGRSQLMRLTRQVNWDKLRIIRCGVHARFMDDAAPPPPADGGVVCVARLVPEKGLHTLVDAIDRLWSTGTRLPVRIIGDGPLMAGLRSAAARMSDPTAITLLGWQGGARVRDELRRSRALVLPSYAENLPVALMEALALGRPVVSTYIGGIPELVEPGRSGWLVPAGSVEHLTDALREVARASCEDLARMGRTGADKVRLMHDGRLEAQRLSDLFQSAVTRRHEPDARR